MLGALVLDCNSNYARVATVKDPKVQQLSPTFVFFEFIKNYSIGKCICISSFFFAVPSVVERQDEILPPSLDHVFVI